ncbi:putative NAD dependent epimerase/dehydratase [Daldinia loculata]|uniref:putative NAD dependent epimerase/dehydratase n=1 Tax=Daldinia loculata TaxID=103429 RepID=UPI0020C269F5|nr:putative NAD dependent epimerase/dehydratase [Daldinia loculata]KAI1643907.1 putative NAD dependent epimerase/dehydratase [Daldinia loculata]
MANQTIFMTGANGYIGSRITEFAVAEGYTVVGLSRSEKGDETLKALGASSIRGDLFSYDILREQSAKADIVIHLADALAQNMDQPYSKVVEIDNKVVDAITDGLKGTNKTFLVTSGTLVTAADPNHGETNETSPLWREPLNDRIGCETYALKQASKGIRVIALRLAPYVYGRGGSGVRLFMDFGAQAGELAYVDDGSVKTTTVHVDDAARAYLLAIKKGRAGEAYNLSYETDVSVKELFEAMGKVLDLPVKSRPAAEAKATMGEFLVGFISTENRASNAKAKTELGWQPREKKIVDDILNGSYVEVAKSMKKPAA